MIVREMDGERLLCIPQPAHALTATQFCRHWGNGTFARPEPYDPVLLAIAQHDSGWIEWERTPQLRPDGVPMDFIHHTDVTGKAAIWRSGIQLAWGQHPYAALLIARHASLLYESGLNRIEYSPEERAVLDEFFADEIIWQRWARRLFADDESMQKALEPAAIEANTRLLQFGDRAALQIAVPWSREHTIKHCPLNQQGDVTAICMTYDDAVIRFDPWPFGIDSFRVDVEGYLLPQRTFATDREYRTALRLAPYYRKSFDVVRTI